jgi:hypothetical protein
VQAVTAVAHEWVNAVSTSGVHSLSQPAFTDISGTLSATQLPTTGSAPFINGGNSFGSAAILGTNDANTLSLEAGGSTAMTILTTGKVGIGTTSPAAALDVTSGGIRPASATQGAACSPLGATGYNSSTGAPLFCGSSGTWSAQSGGQLIGAYSSGSAATNYTMVFTGAAGSTPSLSGSTLTLPSNTAYVTVELWGAGGGGGGGGNGSNGTAGGSSCFGTNSTACTSPTVLVTGGGAGDYAYGVAVGSASGGDVNLSGSAPVIPPYGGGASYIPGGTGGSAPLGGGGASGTWAGAGNTGGAYGGGGGGGATNTATTGYWGGSGGGGGGYASKFINSPSGTYYYTIGAGGTGGAPGAGGVGSGGAGGAGGITVRAYASAVVSTSASSGSGAANSIAVWSSTTALGNSPLTVSGSNVVASGSVSATAFYYTSDRRLKEHIMTIENPIEKVNSLRGVNFRWKDSKEKDIGFIAQEVEIAVPELVKAQPHKDLGEIKTVKYGNIVAIVVEATKAMWKKVLSIDERVGKLEKENIALKKQIEDQKQSFETRLKALEDKGRTPASN